MQYYLYGSALSTRKNGWTDASTYVGQESVKLSLIAEASKLHTESPTGLSLAAHRLKPRKIIQHLRRAKGEHYLILCWVWLSNGSKYRVAWALEDGDGRLHGAWKRVPWSSLVFSTGRLRKQRRRPA